jgi:diguanylate cyclase (GGDEF)-like protein
MAIFIVRRIVEPLKKLTEASMRLSGGDYSVEFVRSDTTELDLLSVAFKNMAKRLCEREKLLRHSANFDSMTGLQNTTSYASWVADFNKELDHKQIDFGIVVLDLNNLKKANDEYGHKVGDALIVTSAKIIADVFQGSPTFRIGGDEFLVVLQNSNLDHSEKLLAQLDFKCANTFVGENAKIPVSIAVGYARFDSDIDLCLKDVINRADAAMYENKRRSKIK